MLLRGIRSRLVGLVVVSVVPFTVLIGVGLWNQWRMDHTSALHRSANEARLLAGQVNDHIGKLKNLLAGLSVAVSWHAEDAEANDRLLRRVRAELPPYVANLLLFSLDGSNIGTSSSAGRAFVGDRDYFRAVVAGQDHAVSAAIRSRAGGEWVMVLARPVRDAEGQLRAVLAVGTRLERLQDALTTAHLPPGSAVRVVNESRIVIAHSVSGPNWIGRDLNNSATITRHFAEPNMSEVALWSDGVERITGSARTTEVPWLVSVGLPADAPMRRMLWRLSIGLSITLGTLLLAVGAAWLLARKIVRPLRQLGHDAATLASGAILPIARGSRIATTSASWRPRSTEWRSRSSSATAMPRMPPPTCGRRRKRWRRSSIRRRWRSSAMIGSGASSCGTVRPNASSASPPKKPSDRFLVTCRRRPSPRNRSDWFAGRWTARSCATSRASGCARTAPWSTCAPPRRPCTVPTVRCVARSAPTRMSPTASARRSSSSALPISTRSPACPTG